MWHWKILSSHLNSAFDQIKWHNSCMGQTTAKNSTKSTVGIICSTTKLTAVLVTCGNLEMTSQLVIHKRSHFLEKQFWNSYFLLGAKSGQIFEANLREPDILFIKGQLSNSTSQFQESICTKHWLTVKLLYNSSVRINPIKLIFYYSKSKEVVLLQVNSRLQIATPLTTAI